MYTIFRRSLESIDILPFKQIPNLILINPDQFPKNNTTQIKNTNKFINNYSHNKQIPTHNNGISSFISYKSKIKTLD